MELLRALRGLKERLRRNVRLREEYFFIFNSIKRMFVSPPTLNPQNPVKLYLNSLFGEGILEVGDCASASDGLD